MEKEKIHHPVTDFRFKESRAVVLAKVLGMIAAVRAGNVFVPAIKAELHLLQPERRGLTPTPVSRSPKQRFHKRPGARRDCVGSSCDPDAAHEWAGRGHV